ncbi:MAG TPA: putative DNA modification/repair radical SAM protein, partial [Tepidisphaeraceae bacterium]
IRRKLQILADAAKYDASCASSGAKRAGTRNGIGNTTGSGICHSYTPDGRCVSLLKILLTNFCIYDCQYCVNRVTSDTPRERFTVDEVVNLTLEFYKRNYIEGLFLSSGVIRSADYTMEQLVSVAKTLRLTHGYNGYIHLKAVPGASEELQRQAGLYADRLSANIELPTAADLKKLAPEKTFEQVDTAMTQIKAGIDASRDRSHTGRRPPRFAPGGQSTQMIVGATPSTDASILATATRLYGQHKLRRVYYSAYSPIPFADGRLPSQQPQLVREHRLYQADWLMRFYGFTADEITTPAAPDLDLRIDPKLAWALRNRHRFPVDLNKAPREMLLRVPGLGGRNVDRLIAQRRVRKIRLADLAKIRAPMVKLKPWVMTDDFNADALRIDRADLHDRIVRPTAQLELFTTAESARSGQL